jgi:mRNA-degrading endonuclease HigB of HigAB toxin-antitoxin module
MRILAGNNLNAYAMRKPRKKECLLAFRALVEAASWRRLKDVEGQFVQAVDLTPPDSVAFDFPEEDLRIETRVNCALGLVRIFSVGPSVRKKRRTP